MNRNANKALNLPHKSKSGANTNSRLFIVAITTICVIALSFVLMPRHEVQHFTEKPVHDPNGRNEVIQKFV
jgi:hypothetical protein